MYDVITIGGATRDIFFEFNGIKPQKDKERSGFEYLKIPYGDKLVTDDTYYCYGGGSVNCAASFSRLGAKTASLCSLGREGSGSLIIDFLKKEKVSTTLVRRDPYLHTGLSIMIVGEDGEHTSFLDRGANDNLIIERWRPLARTKWFYISSLTGHAESLLPEIFDFATRHRIKIAFNPGSKQLEEGYQGLREYLKKTDILLLNHEEATDLVYSKTRKEPKTKTELLSEIEKMGAKISVVTEDGEGCHAVSEGEHYHQIAYSIKVLDTTGAGDSFGSTFTYGVMRNFDIALSLKLTFEL
jgi:sugar/nucleoside kinase (ribokinase family)